ncbi:t-SNARE [Basidiobolus meristosporus CBS 931.73]|uniref:t-SNARE n=1 Tax=Basidiobolus meristosporus CBS 931.73 TaxID=1314790 RepID=A0A1Y1Y5S2_9FUNG|nr:t-SNARE [Basidiobolus meristosporus CBS 931.73]|eukprot:ORX93352.1 t-SNARE [Basidiobolus meristosporus CBS 931.73]
MYKQHEKDLEMGTLRNAHSQTTSLEDFFTEAQTIEESIEKINGNIKTIAELHSHSLDLVSNEESLRISHGLDRTINETRLQLIDTKNRIQAMEVENRKIHVSSNSQIRRNRHAALKMKFLNSLKSYQSIEVTYRDKYQQMIERQIRIVNPDATDEDIGAALDNEHGGVFAQAIMKSNRTNEARSVFQAVQDRHADVKKIEKTILELSNLFQEMHLLVDTQAETLDRIEAQMSEAVIHTSQAEKELSGAMGHATSARKVRTSI